MFDELPNIISLNEGEKSEPSSEIVRIHKELETAVLLLRESVIAEVKADGQELDSSGWRVYGFDSLKVTPDQVTSIDLSDPDLEPEIEIEFYPMSEVDSETGAIRRTPESCTVMNYATGGAEKAGMELLPIGSEKPEWTQLTIEPSGFYSTIPLLFPEVISNSQVNEVVVSNVPASRAQEAQETALANLMGMEQVAQNIKGKKYHYRVFGNTSREVSSQKPKFIIANTQLPSKTD